MIENEMVCYWRRVNLQKDFQLFMIWIELQLICNSTIQTCGGFCTRRYNSRRDWRYYQNRFYHEVDFLLGVPNDEVVRRRKQKKLLWNLLKKNARYAIPSADGKNIYETTLFKIPMKQIDKLYLYSSVVSYSR